MLTNIRPKSSIISDAVSRGKYFWDGKVNKAYVTLSYREMVEVDWTLEGTICCTYVKRLSLFRKRYYYQHFSKWEDLTQKEVLVDCIGHKFAHRGRFTYAFVIKVLRYWFDRP